MQPSHQPPSSLPPPPQGLGMQSPQQVPSGYFHPQGQPAGGYPIHPGMYYPQMMRPMQPPPPSTKPPPPPLASAPNQATRPPPPYGYGFGYPYNQPPPPQNRPLVPPSGLASASTLNLKKLKSKKLFILGGEGGGCMMEDFHRDGRVYNSFYPYIKEKNENLADEDTRLRIQEFRKTLKEMKERPNLYFNFGRLKYLLRV
jgi:hypothetical protein